MNYETGEEVKIGDSVLIEKGTTPGVVKEIIQSITQMEEWSVNEEGILLESPPFGLVFWPMSIVDDPIQFVARQCCE